MAADVVGYSALMSADETATIADLKAHHSTLFDPMVDEFGGQIVKLMGDGTLVLFPSVVNAVECGIAIQEANAAADGPIKLRIGIHLGDVVSEDGEVYGDGVNIAARLETLADTGGICVSDMVLKNLQGPLESLFSEMGEQNLKNISRPINTWQWRRSGEISPDLSMPPHMSGSDQTASDKPAIAVLPFRNLSGDPSQEYFSDGLTEDLITAISYWRSFPVIARDSSFSFKGHSGKTGDIAKELGARYVLGGSVRVAGNRIRITASLVDAAREYEIWSERFDRQLNDIFEVQDEITNRVAAVVGHEIERAELNRISVSGDRDFTSWDLVIQGIPHFLENNCQSNDKAREFFKKATEISPGYEDAWAYLAWTYSHDLMLNCEGEAELSTRLGLEAGKRAVALNDNSALAHLAYSSVLVWSGDAPNSLAEAQRAHQLNPNDVRAGFAVGNRLTLKGEFSKGVEIIEASMQLDPTAPYRWHYFGYLSRALLSLGEVDRAVEAARQAVMLRPDEPSTHFRLALCHAHQGDLARMNAELAVCESLKPGFVESRKDWKPYANEEFNNQILAPFREAGIM
jgi:adenylate cyclase